eukprot:scaffold7260_cov57-Attheya_sp.AAC.1
MADAVDSVSLTLRLDSTRLKLDSTNLHLQQQSYLSVCPCVRICSVFAPKKAAKSHCDNCDTASFFFGDIGNQHNTPTHTSPVDQ